MRDPMPEVRERAHSPLASADGETVGKHDGVHGAGTRRADAVDLEPRLFQEPVENAPGKGAMSPSALQRKICNFRFRRHCPSFRPASDARLINLSSRVMGRQHERRIRLR